MHILFHITQISPSYYAYGATPLMAASPAHAGWHANMDTAPHSQECPGPKRVGHQ